MIQGFLKFILSLFKKAPIEMEYIPTQPPATTNPAIPTTPVNTEAPTPPKANRDILYQVAKESLGVDISPRDVAPDEYGCAESVWNVLNKAFPNNVGFPLVVSTVNLFDHLNKCSLYVNVATPMPGDIILCVTGTGNGKVSNGHTGIVGIHGIMSNDSYTGKWMQNYNLQTWDAHYHEKGGYPIHFFRRV